MADQIANLIKQSEDRLLSAIEASTSNCLESS